MKNKHSAIIKSAKYSFSIIAGASTLASLGGYTIRDINRQLPWWYLLFGIFVCFLVFAVICYLAIRLYTHKNYSTTINGKSVQVMVGNIFDFQGLILIPFNDGFDMVVDDIIINHSSLQGQMLDGLSPKDKKELDDLIKNTKGSYEGGLIPIGTLVRFKNYMLLSLAHFNASNNAYIDSFGEYEKILIDLWTSIRRVYASKPIAIPLLGAGTADIIGTKKNPTDMLKCLLCTLRSSNFQPENGVCIIVNQKTMEVIDMNVIRDEFA